MARTYRFFSRNITAENFLQNQGMGRTFQLTENLEPEIFYQLTKVLRVKPGDTVVILPAISSAPFYEFVYTVQDVQKKNILLAFERQLENMNELNFRLCLILCLPNKPEKLEFILQKAVELGVQKVILVQGEFSQFKHSVREERLQKILMEASEQSERARVPELAIEGKFKDFLESVSSQERSLIWVAMERSSHTNDSTKKQKSLQEVSGDTSVLIGPEGGFSNDEKKFIDDLGLKTFSLGRRILRMETAAIVSLGLISTSPHLQ